MLGKPITTQSTETLAEYLDDWLAHRKNLRPSTVHLYSTLIRVHVKPRLGHIRLSKLTAGHLNEGFGHIPGARSREQVQRLMRKALGDAVRLEKIPSNPSDRLEIQIARPKKKRRWTLEETQQFISACIRYEHAYDALWLFMLGSGCRIGEALALHEDDVNWQAGSIKVERGVIWVGKTWELGPPKTEAGDRRIALMTIAFEALKAQRKHLSGGYFFRTQQGTMPWATDLKKRLTETCFRAGLPDRTTHDLRKQHATLAVATGVDVKTVQHRLGHASLAMTLGLYADALDGGDDLAAKALDALIASRGTDRPRRSRSDAKPT
jgi:integrase